MSQASLPSPFSADAAWNPAPEPPERSSPPGETCDAAVGWRTAESEEHRNGGNAAGDRGWTPAWSVPANGASEAGPVMGADCWPSLPESASRVSIRSSSLDSLMALSDGPSAAAALGSMIASSQMKLNAKSTNPISSQDHDALGRQGPNSSPNLMKRRGGTGSSSAANHGPGASQEPHFISEMPPVSVDTSQGSSPQGIADHGNSNLGRHRRDEFLPQLQSGSNNQRSGYGGNKRGNAHHRRHGSRRDQEQGGYDWSGPRGFSGRDSHMLMPLPQQRGQSQPFIRAPPPPTTAPFVGMPPYFRPFVSPLGYPEFHSALYYLPPPPPTDTLRSMPFIAHQLPHMNPPAMFLPPADHQRFMLVKQIEYYFSPDNLCKDLFLRRNMDDQGWVPISLIASFNRVKQLTRDMPHILDAVRGSTVVEVQGEKIRKRGDWMKWMMPPTPNQYDLASGSQSPLTPGYDSVIAHMHTFGLDEGSSHHSMS
ncbi:la-related protein 1C-like isoform X1 [Musa acuminata AAA Group]|uniref:la-related protein 1C-like isoform X1 n=1 Tax=Musa acuminata AAA Group TaxID=214697 RepID=UPI0031DA1F12